MLATYIFGLRVHVSPAPRCVILDPHRAMAHAWPCPGRSEHRLTRSESNPALANGIPSRSILILLYPDPLIVGLSARCDPNGTYRIGRLPPGLTHVSISRLGTQEEVTKSVTIEEGKTTVLDFDLASTEERDS